MLLPDYVDYGIETIKFTLMNGNYSYKPRARMITTHPQAPQMSKPIALGQPLHKYPDGTRIINEKSQNDCEKPDHLDILWKSMVSHVENGHTIEVICEIK